MDRKPFQNMMNVIRSALELYLKDTKEAKNKSNIASFDSKIGDITRVIRLDSIKEGSPKIYDKYFELEPKEEVKRIKEEKVKQVSVLEDLPFPQEILDKLPTEVKRVISPQNIVKARRVVSQIYVDEKIKDYILNIVFASREPEKYNLEDLKDLIAYGASPRASIYLNLCAKAHAFLKGRGYVTPEDIKAIGTDVLRHRVIVTYEAEAEEIASEDIVKKIFDEIEVP